MNTPREAVAAGITRRARWWKSLTRSIMPLLGRSASAPGPNKSAHLLQLLPHRHEPPRLPPERPNGLLENNEVADRLSEQTVQVHPPRAGAGPTVSPRPVQGTSHPGQGRGRPRIEAGHAGGRASTRATPGCSTSPRQRSNAGRALRSPTRGSPRRYSGSPSRSVRTSIGFGGLTR